jgi:rsbT co-antagonist protein RsbR
MSSDPDLRARWPDEDRALLRTLGGRISQIIHGEDLDIPDLQRRDELGILANMLSRLAREVGASRRRDLQYRAELEHRVSQLQAAYQIQEKLLGTIRELSSPILEPHEGVVLLPLFGALEAPRIAAVLPALLERVVLRQARAVVLHITDEGPLSAECAALLIRAERSALKVGARVILSGPVAAPVRQAREARLAKEAREAQEARDSGLVGEDFAPTPAPRPSVELGLIMLATDLQEALTTALDLVGYRITR